MSEPGTEIEVTRTYLQLTRREDFHAAYLDDERAQIVQVQNCPASFYRYLYGEVGRFYHWTDRLAWTDAEMVRHLSQDGLTLYVMYYAGAPAGYFELRQEADGATELAYFGLLPEYIGKGLGKHLLSAAIDQAWRDGTTRVWLHTCTLDGAAALPNYLKRGFQPFKEEKYVTTIAPDEELRGAL
ncbi:MAG: GNAT family N-acetyltransferase [Acidobacteria bacterium]|nr:GNAT family N-acetyltransferase [Acidobacteriota bacterium]